MNWRAAPALAATLGLGGGAAAEIVTDGTTGPRLELAGPEFDIRADLGTRAGGNLFHSFDRFSLRNGESATFSGPAADNVIARVTGGARSTIDGTLRSTIAGADLYFINPAGILFGPNATLDVPASFHVSTTDELRFTDGEVFSARDPAASSFSIAAPEAFGFMGNHRGPISVNSSLLEVPEGETLALTGGDITIFDANLGGHIEAGPGGGIDSFRFLNLAGRVEISARNLLIVNTIVLAGPTSFSDRAVIDIDATRMDLFGAFIATPAKDGAEAASIEVEADILNMNASSHITSSAFRDGEGDAGPVTIVAGQLDVLDGSTIDSATFSDGNAGDVSVSADEVTIADRRDPPSGVTGITSDAELGTGDAGIVTVVADRITLLDGGRIRSITADRGRAGNVNVTATSQLLIGRGSSPFITGISADALISDEGIRSTGSAGQVHVIARDILILDGGTIASATFAEGDGGSVDVVAERLTIAGLGSQYATGIIASTQDTSTGDAGSITVDANQVVVFDASISSEAFGNGSAGAVVVTADHLEVGDQGSLSSSSFGDGAAGNVRIHGGEVLVDGGLVSTAVGGTGQGGRITVDASAVTIRNGAVLSSARRGGFAGRIRITSTGQVIFYDAHLRTDSDLAGGGQIILRGDELIDLHDSEVTTSVTQGRDPTAGDIRIDPEVLVIDGSVIRAVRLKDLAALSLSSPTTFSSRVEASLRCWSAETSARPGARPTAPGVSLLMRRTSTCRAG